MSDWITKQEAAALLETSTRTIERYIRAGRLQTQKRQRSGKSPETMVRLADVQAMQPGAFLLPPANETQMTHTVSHTPATIPAPQLPEALLQLVAKLATITTPVVANQARDSGRPWQTLAEAAAGSGLSRRLIRNLIQTGEVIAVKDGRSWRVNQPSLNSWKPRTTDPNPSSSQATKSLRSAKMGSS